MDTDSLIAATKPTLSAIAKDNINLGLFPVFAAELILCTDPLWIVLSAEIIRQPSVLANPIAINSFAFYAPILFYCLSTIRAFSISSIRIGKLDSASSKAGWVWTDFLKPYNDVE